MESIVLIISSKFQPIRFLVSSCNAPGGALRDDTKNACEGDYYEVWQGH